jgi:2-iminobutanoate/2-iminopropanoate deaminase
MSPKKQASIPKAVGPYRHAVETSGLVFVSGQIPVNPATGDLVSGDIRAATRQVLENLSAVLGSAGLEPGDVVKTTIYLANIGDFGAVNEVYAAFFKDPYPARACIQVAALPKGAAIEIEAIAISRSGIPNEP